MTVAIVLSPADGMTTFMLIVVNVSSARMVATGAYVGFTYTQFWCISQGRVKWPKNLRPRPVFEQNFSQVNFLNLNATALVEYNHAPILKT